MGIEDKKFKFFIEERLKEKDLNLKKLSEISGISLNNLDYLINEDFKNLPAAPYIRGYLIKLGKILNFNSEEWWDYFKNQRNLKKSGEYDEFPKNRFMPPSFTKYFFIILIIIFALIYFVVRFDNIFGNPTIELNIPISILKATEKKFIVQGSVKNADKLFINLEEVVFNKNGDFSKEIVLEPGINTVEIRIQKLFKPEIKILRQIFYEQIQNSTTSVNNFSNN